MNRIEAAQRECHCVGLHELVPAIPGLWFDIHPHDVEPCPLVAFRRSASATEQIQKTRFAHGWGRTPPDTPNSYSSKSGVAHIHRASRLLRHRGAHRNGKRSPSHSATRKRRRIFMGSGSAPEGPRPPFSLLPDTSSTSPCACR